jgi:hypothetical protein
LIPVLYQESRGSLRGAIMNFKQSLKSFSTVGTLGIVLGASLAVPVQAAQMGLSQQKTSNAPTLVAQGVRNLRQRQQRNRRELIQRQQNIRQNYRQRQQNYLQRLRDQGASPGVIQDRRQRQRESLQDLRERQRDNLQDQRQRQQDLLRDRARENRLDRRFYTDRQRRFYNDYLNYRNRDYYRDRYWINRNYSGDRAYWSGPGYWYDRDYWGGRGYIWDDIIGGVVGGLVQGAISSAVSPREVYTYAPQILSYNRLSSAACEPGNIVILLPNQRVICAYPTATYPAGTYQVRNNYALFPAAVDYRNGY